MGGKVLSRENNSGAASLVTIRPDCYDLATYQTYLRRLATCDLRLEVSICSSTTSKDQVRLAFGEVSRADNNGPRGRICRLDKGF